MNASPNHQKEPMETRPFVTTLFLAIVSLLATGGQTIRAEDRAKTSLKIEHFDRDPGWDNSVNRAEASDPPTVTQDFGWSAGKIGGSVRRSMTPAWYGMPLERPLSFRDAFSASGKITATRDPSGEGTAYLGFFNHERQGWRPWSSMAMRVVNDGDIAPLPQFFQRLKQIGYDGIVSLHSEYKGAHSFRRLTTPELLEQSAADLRYLKQVIAKL